MLNIFLINWNSSDVIKESLEGSIIRSDLNDYRVILIDNNSYEDEKNVLFAIYEKWKNKCDIHLVLNDGNYGYAGGNNKGYDYLKFNKLDGDILILNSDVQLSKDTLRVLQDSMGDSIGIVMCRTLKPDGCVLYDFIKLDGFKQKWVSGHYQTTESDYAAGSCMLIKRDIVDKIGLFDERFFLYWEEVDFSVKVKKLGYRIISTSKSAITRKDNPAERNINAVYFYIRNSFYLRANHPEVFSLNQHIVFLTYSLLSQAKLCIQQSEPKRLLKFIRGLFDGVAGC